MAEKYLQDVAAIVSATIMSSSSSSSMMDPYYVSPPYQFGFTTLQKLLNSKVLFSQKQHSNHIIHRTWSLKEFWELASWPRDAAGGANFRYGFPVTEDVELILAQDENPKKITSASNQENGTENDALPGDINNYVLNISSLDELDKVIVSTKKTCLMFFSASYCRTCKALTPQYHRLARRLMDESKGDVTLVKADVSSMSGKILSRALDVDAVPTFVMFSRGKLYGDPLSISRIPSKKLDLAIQYLSEGKLWNRKAFESIES
jgi:thiol-disulfide isomerase/thioredoxin